MEQIWDSVPWEVHEADEDPCFASDSQFSTQLNWPPVAYKEHSAEFRVKQPSE